jgi:hypothetical protein
VLCVCTVAYRCCHGVVPPEGSTGAAAGPGSSAGGARRRRPQGGRCCRLWQALVAAAPARRRHAAHRCRGEGRKSECVHSCLGPVMLRDAAVAMCPQQRYAGHSRVTTTCRRLARAAPTATARGCWHCDHDALCVPCVLTTPAGAGRTAVAARRLPACVRGVPRPAARLVKPTPTTPGTKMPSSCWASWCQVWWWWVCA